MKGYKFQIAKNQKIKNVCNIVNHLFYIFYLKMFTNFYKTQRLNYSPYVFIFTLHDDLIRKHNKLIMVMFNTFKKYKMNDKRCIKNFLNVIN